jgi:radical SAM superfamily enzyme YgiQ (UPF0313 family)
MNSARLSITLVTALIVPEAEAEDPRERVQLGPLCIAATLRQAGYNVSLLNLNSVSPIFQSKSILLDQNRFIEYAANTLRSMGNTIIGFGSICSSYRMTLHLIKRVKELMPDAFVFIGGPQATATDRQTLEVAPYIDAVVRGEADLSVLDLIKTYEAGNDLATVKGITWINASGSIVRNLDSDLIHDLDVLPMPAYDLYGDSSYSGGIPIDAGRGCPFACSFCSTNEFFRRRFRMKSPGRLAEELNYLNRIYGSHQFSLTHDLFTTNPAIVREVCATFQEAIGFHGLEWTASARIDSMKDNLAAEMAEAGCRSLFFGVETGSENMQKVIKKRLTVSRILPTLKECSDLNIESTASIIIGYPEETYEDIRDSVRLSINASKLGRVKVQMHLLVPLPGTPLSVTNYDRLEYSDLCSNIATVGGSELSEREREYIVRNKAIFTQHFFVPNQYYDRATLYHIAQVTFFGTSYFKYTCIFIERMEGGFTDFAFKWAAWIQENIDCPDYLFEAFYRDAQFYEKFEAFVQVYCSSIEPSLQNIISGIMAFERHVQEHIKGDFYNPGSRQTRHSDFDLSKRMRLAENVSIKYFDINLDQLLHALTHDEKLPKPLKELRPYIFSEFELGRIGFSPLDKGIAAVMNRCDGKHILGEAIAGSGVSSANRRLLLGKIALLISKGLIVPVEQEEAVELNTL